MHFSTTLLVLSGASAALAGSFAAPAAPASHLALRQASRDQVVRRQHMQKMRRQAEPSAVLNRCGAQSSFVLQFSDINSQTGAADGNLNDLNGQYVVGNGDDKLQSFGNGAALDATPFSLNSATCDFETPTGLRFANVDGSDKATNQPLYYSTQEQADTADAQTGGTSVKVICSIVGRDFTCSRETSPGNVLNTLVICNNAADSSKFLGLTTETTSNSVDGCTPVTLTAMRA